MKNRAALESYINLSGYKKNLIKDDILIWIFKKNNQAAISLSHHFYFVKLKLSV